MAKTVLVFGASGTIGQGFIKASLEKGYPSSTSCSYAWHFFNDYFHACRWCESRGYLPLWRVCQESQWETREPSRGQVRLCCRKCRWVNGGNWPSVNDSGNMLSILKCCTYSCRLREGRCWLAEEGAWEGWQLHRCCGHCRRFQLC